MFAKQVAGYAGMEAVFSEAFFTAEQAEPVGRNNQVQVTGFLANRTVTPVHIDHIRNIDFKFHPPAMASSITFVHLSNPHHELASLRQNRHANKASDGP